MTKILRTVSRIVHHNLTSHVPVVAALVSSEVGEIAQTVVLVARVLVPPPPRE